MRVMGTELGAPQKDDLGRRDRASEAREMGEYRQGVGIWSGRLSQIYNNILINKDIL